MDKSGLSVVIGSVLLVLVVIVLGGIIFFWANDFVANLEPPIFECNEVVFEAGVFCENEACFLDVVNKGNIILNGFLIKEITVGSLEVVQRIEERVDLGSSKSFELEKIYLQGDEILIIPLVENSALEIAECRDESGREIVV